MNGLLFIDDEEGIRRSVARALKHTPYEVFLAGTGDEGIERVKARPEQISTVVSDYKMPGKSGLETLAAIGRINPDITRIILTGYATMDAAIQATNDGIDGFLTKPFDNAELRSKIGDISLRKRLKQFVPEAVYNRIQGLDALAPRHHRVSILFCDIREFTRMSEGASPEALADFLNHQFFSPMGEIAYSHNGIIDKLMGDSLMVVFGALSPQPEDAENALKAALAMQEKAGQIDGVLAHADGFRMAVGIGISTGEVFSGLIGSLRKREFTSIGMPVNVASRLQNLAAAGEILVTTDTLASVRETDFLERLTVEALPPTPIRGIFAPLSIFKISSPEGS